MNAPFSPEQFIGVFKIYNEAVFPAQIVLYCFALFAIFLAFKPAPNSDRIINIVLSFLWIWMGVVYHLIYFSPINKAAYLFGILFVLQGILFLRYGILHNRLTYKFTKGLYGVTGIIFVLYALLFYPLFGFYFGHIYPSSPTFGLPCPTTIFTFGMLLFSDRKLPSSIIIIPFIWSLIGFTAVINFGIIEDTGLLIAGLITLFMFIKRNRSFKLSGKTR
jgi:hypothetical protein